MNTEFDELVRDSMSQFTAGVTVPAGLVGRARQHVRRRRVRTGWLAAAAVASATTGLVATAVGPARPAGPGQDRNIQARLTALVINHVVKALTRTAAANSVEYQRSTGGSADVCAVPSEGRPISAAKFRRSRRPVFMCGVISKGRPISATIFRVASVVDWYRDGVLDEQSYSPSGRLVLETRQVTGPRTSIETYLNYPERLWSRRIARNDGPPLTRPVARCLLDVEFWTPAQWARQMQQLVGCGNVQVQGRQWINGVDAIRLRTHSGRVRTCFSVAWAPGRVGTYECVWGYAGWAGTVLIDPSTYLPIRFVSDATSDAQRLDFRFLPPTKPNLAKLRLTIPPGFERV